MLTCEQLQFDALDNWILIKMAFNDFSISDDMHSVIKSVIK